METLQGRTAVVTGAASGIGLGIARRMARHGARVALLDVDEEALEEALREVSVEGTDCIAVRVDVAEVDSVRDAAAVVADALGNVHVLVNNAGVVYNRTPLWETAEDDVQWSFAVNVFGVVHGVRAFVPAMLAHGDGGHIVNTSSIGGFQVRRHKGWHQGLYAATKFAVVALSEGLRGDLASHGIGVTILAPGPVATRIGSSDRNRQPRFGGPTRGSQRGEMTQLLEDSGIDPMVVGERVVQAVLDNELYVFTHLDVRSLIEARHAAIMRGFDIAAAAGATQASLT